MEENRSNAKGEGSTKKKKKGGRGQQLLRDTNPKGGMQRI